MRQRLRRVKSLRARLVNQQFGTSEDLLALLAGLETISQAQLAELLDELSIQWTTSVLHQVIHGSRSGCFKSGGTQFSNSPPL